MKVLIVEDSETDQQLITRCLSGVATKIKAVKTIREARDSVLTWHPDVITLDGGLPDAEIADISVLVAEFKGWCGVVVLTGVEETAIYAWEAKHAGADDFLNKQVLSRDPERLRDAVRQARASFRYRTVGEATPLPPGKMTKSQRLLALEIERNTIPEPDFKETPPELFDNATDVQRHLINSVDEIKNMLIPMARGLNVNTTLTLKNKAASEHTNGSVAEAFKEIHQQKQRLEVQEAAVKILVERNNLIDKWLGRLDWTLDKMKEALQAVATHFVKFLGYSIAALGAYYLLKVTWEHYMKTPLPPIPTGP